jgi:hypothetical protein
MGVMKRQYTARSFGGGPRMSAVDIAMQGRASFGLGTAVFFDKPEVEKAIGRARASALRRSGGYLRKVARSLIKKVGKARTAPKQFTPSGKVSKAWLRWSADAAGYPSSPPGQPPYTHTRSKFGLRDAIMFAYEGRTQNVVVGPAASVIAKVGRTHEYGGTEYDNAAGKRQRKPNWILREGGHGPMRQDITGGIGFAKLSTPAQVARSKRLATIIAPKAVKDRTGNKPRRYPARPFMAPSLKKSAPALAGFWRNSITAR